MEIVLVICCCSPNASPKLVLNLKDKYVFANIGKVSSVDIVIAPDSGIYNHHVKIEASTDTIFFAKQLDSLIEICGDKKSVEMYFNTSYKSGNHLFQFHFYPNELVKFKDTINLEEVVD